MRAVYEVLGIKKAKSAKTGRDCFTYYLKTEFSDYEQETAECEGFTVLNEFSYTDYSVKVGDFVELEYIKGFQDKATLSDMIPVKNPYQTDNKQTGTK